MNKKVWIIDEHAMGGTSAKRRMENRSGSRLAAKTPQKNPALAFSLSMLVWGSGHLYIREFGLGSKFMGCMLFFYSVIMSIVVFREAVTGFIFDNFIPVPVLLIGGVVFFIFGLACWIYGAVDAYFRTVSLRSEHFRGAGNELWPLLCSLFFPGWGQFLNGQPKKGLFFLLFGALGIYSLLFVLISLNIWPTLSSSPDRFVFEIYLSAALLVLPLCFLMWMAAAHDSFWSCRESVRKRPLSARFQFTRDRIRAHGLGRYLIPKIKSKVIFGVLLAVAIMAGREYVPKSYYLDGLERIRVEMLSRHMEMLPELVEKAIVFLG
jgi:TM2 domain-containing membrane protein YozV